jgi:hypothetical protein
MELLGFDSATLAEDGRHIELELETDTGALAIEANIMALESVIAQLTPILLKAREMRGGLSAAAPVKPMASDSKPTQDRQRVWLSLRMPNGLDMAFALEIADADHLQSRMADAVKRCRTA